MAVTYTNGFTTDGYNRIIGALFNQTNHTYAPYGSVTFPSPGGTSTWGYGKDNTTSLPTPQNFVRTIGGSQANFGNDSNPFDITRPPTALTVNITGVQFLDASNAPIFEVNVNDTAQFIYDGEFTIIGGSSVDFSTNTDFYAK